MKQADLRLWDEVLQNRIDGNQKFLTQLPLEVTQEELSGDDRVFFDSSWCSQEEARGVHGLPYTELPEHAWVSSSSFLLDGMA